MARMRFPRYRKPSVKTMIGMTRTKKHVKKDIGVTATMQPMRTPGNMERTALLQAGYYSEPVKFLRFLGRIFK